MKFWQWSLLIVLVIVGFIINLLDKRKANITFAYRELPHLQPVKIPTKGKGFWKGIVMWLLSTRNWVVTQDWKYRMNGNEYIIPAGFQFDGASIPKFLHTFLSPVGVLLMGGLVHDYAYKYETLLRANKIIKPIAIRAPPCSDDTSLHLAFNHSILVLLFFSFSMTVPSHKATYS